MPNPEKLESLATSFDRVLNVEGKSPRTRILYAQSITYLSDWPIAQVELMAREYIATSTGTPTDQVVINWRRRTL